MPNGLGAGDSLKKTDTFSFFRGERDAVSPGRRDIELSELSTYINNTAESGVSVGGGTSTATTDRLDALEKNLGINFLRDSIAEGWTVFNMSEGVTDVFEDYSGVATFTLDTRASDSYFTNEAPVQPALLIQSDTTTGSTTVTDLSSNGLTCTPNNQFQHGKTVTATDCFGGTTTSLEFDGVDDAITITHDSALNFGTSDFTIEFWLYPTKTSGTTNAVLYKNAGAPNKGWRLDLDSVNDHLSFEFSAQGDGSSSTIVSADDGSITKNAWNHCSVCLVGTTLTFRVDGESVGTGTVPNGVNDTTNNLVVSFASASVGFSGSLDDLIIIQGTGIRTSDFPKPVKFYSTNTATTDGVVTSVAQSASTAPTNARAVILHDPVDSLTLNTDTVFAVSRDNGVTFTDFTLTKEADYGTIDGGNVEILSSDDLSISSQPSGTSMVFKFTTANTKKQRFHGAYLQWR